MNKVLEHIDDVLKLKSFNVTMKEKSVIVNIKLDDESIINSVKYQEIFNWLKNLDKLNFDTAIQKIIADYVEKKSIVKIHFYELHNIQYKKDKVVCECLNDGQIIRLEMPYKKLFEPLYKDFAPFIKVFLIDIINK
jgi:hypothetical protein